MKTATTLALEFASNFYGSLSPDIKARIIKYLNKPTHGNWDEIYCLIISTSRLRTVWQAVCMVDPSFPQRTKDSNNPKEKWSAIPSPETVIKAIGQVVLNSNVSN